MSERHLAAIAGSSSVFLDRFLSFFQEIFSPDDARLRRIDEIKERRDESGRVGGENGGRAPLHAVDEGIRRLSNWLAVNPSDFFLPHLRLCVSPRLKMLTRVELEARTCYLCLASLFWSCSWQCKVKDFVVV